MEYRISTALISRPMSGLFDYIVDAPVEPLPGARVKVPFGTTQDNIAVLVRTAQPGQTAALERLELKSAELLDDLELIPPDVFALCQYAAEYYHYPLGQCFFTALPSLLREGRAAAFKESPALTLSVKGRAADAELPAELKNAGQRQLFTLLKQHGAPIFKQELRDRGFTSYALAALVKRGLAEEVMQSTADAHTWQEGSRPVLKHAALNLNSEQQEAANAVCAALGTAQNFLLYGITGSGKTEVYLHIIAKVLERGQAALVLVPEIALTPQTVERFYQRFNAPVILMHSALSPSERLNAWLTMKTGKGAVLIGTRSALFTPIPHLGLIVLDEEHDSSFKQGDGLRYHARTLAQQRAALNSCPLVLGSATPSLETLQEVMSGKTVLLQLTRRAGAAQLPEIVLIDQRAEPLTLGVQTGIGITLENEIGIETVKGNQVMLFLNRRGYAHQLICHHCGKVITCPHCDTPLTVHRSDNRLLCHICDSAFPLPRTCPHCGSAELLENGYGTEQVEHYLKLRYPDVIVDRLDRDAVKNKADLDVKLAHMRSGQTRILAGTQMVAKGHDFPGVTLVGILDLDAGLFSDDFRALEFTAQLLTQVAGRAGRAERPGRVLIQTHHPEHPLLQLLIQPQTSYLTVAQQLLALRAQRLLPPVSAQAFLLSNSSVREKAHAFLSELMEGLKPHLPEFPGLNCGPVISDKIEKRRNRYHFHVQVLSRDRNELSAFLTLAQRRADIMGRRSDVRFACDVDPLFMY